MILRLRERVLGTRLEEEEDWGVGVPGMCDCGFRAKGVDSSFGKKSSRSESWLGELSCG